MGDALIRRELLGTCYAMLHLVKLTAAPLLLLLLACVGAAHAQGLLGGRLSTLRCGGVTPAPIPSAGL